MKALFYLLLLAALITNCQPQTKPAVAVKTHHPAPPVPLSSLLAEAAVVEKGSASLPMMVSEMAPPVTDVPAFLTANNLAPLWQADFGQEDYKTSRPTILDGFFGAEHRHISFIFERVTQDSIQPNVFQVQGRSRFRKNIIPFVGTITVNKINPFRVFLDLDSAVLSRASAYVATARFVLHEDSTIAGAGIYQGAALLDFYRLAPGELNIITDFSNKDLATGGGGQLFRGQWQSYRTGKRRSVAFANYSQAVLPDAMADFYLGDRGESINPKYAGLDWNEAWDNDEWWAKPAKPALSL